MRTVVLIMVAAMLVAACEPSAAQPTTAQVTVQAPAPAPTIPASPPTSLPTSTATAAPARTPIASPSPTPAPSLTRITEGRCCTQPFWAPDSNRVLFIDKPSANAPTGIYAVDVNAPAAPKLLSERVAFYTSDLLYAQTIDGPFAVVTRLSDGRPSAEWRIRTGGRTVLLSPDRSRVLWSETPQTGPTEQRTTVVMGANIDGSQARPIVSLLRAGVNAWLDEQHLLMSARLDRASQEVTLFVYSLADGSQQPLVKSEHLRTVLLSPSGDWIAYTIVFDKTAEQNGLWLMRSDGSAKKRLDVFGAFQWRDGHRLVYVPLEPGSARAPTPNSGSAWEPASHVFAEYDAATDSKRQLTDPAAMPFKIGNGDWAVSPDGRKIVFLSAEDWNLWLWKLVD